MAGVKFLAEFRHAGRVAGAGRVERDELGDSRVIESHQCGLAQEFGRLGPITPVERSPRAFGQGDGAARFELTVGRSSNQSGHDG